MATTMSYFFTLAFCILLSLSHAQLQLYRAGPYSLPVRTLGETDQICPSDFGSAGFTISCTIPSDIKPKSVYVLFYVGDVLTRMEKYAPFYIAGDRSSRSMTYAWKDFPLNRETDVTCALKRRNTANFIRTFNSTVAFACNDNVEPGNGGDDRNDDGGRDFTGGGGPAYTPPPPFSDPGGLYFVPAAGSMVDKMAIRGVPRSDFCPDSMLDTPDFSVECIASEGAQSVVFFVDGEVYKSVAATSTGRFFINGGDGDMPVTWSDYPSGAFSLACESDLGDETEPELRGVTIFCPTDPNDSAPTPTATATAFPSIPPPLASPTPTSSPIPSASSSPPPLPSSTSTPSAAPPSAAPPAGNLACTVLELCDERPVYGMSSRWKQDTLRGEQGLLYRSFPSRSYQSSLEYRFRPSVSTRYGILVEMTHQNRNTIPRLWVKFSGNIKLTRRSGANRNVNGWVSVFSSLGRRTVSGPYGVYTLSSKYALTKGRRYTISIAGASRGVFVKNIFLFPCGSPKNCQHLAPSWHRSVAYCVSKTTK